LKVRKTGFSLVELLVVISIIAVLSAVLMVNFVGTRERSRDSQKIQDLNAIKSALRMFYNDNQRYPTNSELRGVGFTGYISSLGDTNFVYSLGDSDSFTITIKLEVGAGDDDINSQKECGMPTQEDKLYAVCAK
jgi:prepilin-type N-terminal cleavage/methylation domain-containing protein